MIEPDRLISPDISASEERYDRALRPVTLDEYVGQPVVKEQLEIFIEAARRRSEPLDHTLVLGPPGLGKTTLAHIIAHEMQVDLKTTSGPVLEKAGVSELTRSFVGVVARNRRLFALDDMCVGYREMLARRRGEITAEVTTAQPLTDGQRDTLVQELREAMGAKVTLDTQVDASLLGGMIVKIGSRMVDSSLRTKLQRLELSLKGAA